MRRNNVPLREGAAARQCGQPHAPFSRILAEEKAEPENKAAQQGIGNRQPGKSKKGFYFRDRKVCQADELSTALTGGHDHRTECGSKTQKNTGR